MPRSASTAACRLRLGCCAEITGAESVAALVLVLVAASPAHPLMPPDRFKHPNPQDKKEVPGGFLSDCDPDSLKIHMAMVDRSVRGLPFGGCLPHTHTLILQTHTSNTHTRTRTLCAPRPVLLQVPRLRTASSLSAWASSWWTQTRPQTWLGRCSGTGRRRGALSHAVCLPSPQLVFNLTVSLKEDKGKK